ncbi:2-dehydro-3-deoxy-D-gluconate 5-dehydrogenase KduD (plasmid) [Phyllobacterium sp. A18/5-2]|uniref:2-dehydro-3-deoxy-D-gluconate 5-dehydrogenase KduD n=1 Tax=Phyllobacterium sp. A18/5-2 TaxID=2978392 RepID=UPI0021C5A1AF|nr:2-dehydro-3-deoxy-D-gluconate 5-dehydrogenase KduD [Phyllobacterium sp. A18/5-2]UXN66391.1 2-dehydro-3-deoxy-D-gluconate 5-dehydrogenase KduD [Phyllobacterium sp. A18/5-2]
MTELSSFSLEGKTIVVTGANTGIGQGIAVSVSRAGGSVVGVGRSDMSETARMVETTGGKFTQVLCDLRDVEQAIRVVEEIWQELGAIDGLVNNAGIIRRADALDFSLEDWDEVMDVNLRSVFFMSQALAKNIVAQGRRGKIVNIASMLSFQGGIRVASYTASKSGLVGITRLLACEWAAKGINVNAIAPGYIVSANTQALRSDPQRNEAILSRIPAGRWGDPHDIGDAAVFLLAKASHYMHGAVVPVDGGWLAR